MGERAAEEAAALKAIHANWRDDVERTSVMQPKFLAPAYAAARAAGVSAPKPQDYDEDGPTGTYQERDLWPVTPPRGAPSPFPPRSSGIAMKAAPRYTPSRPAQTPSYTRSPASHVPTQVSAAPPAPAPVPSASEPMARPKFPVPAAVWSSGSASTVPPRPRRINRASSNSAAKVPVQPEPSRSSSPPALPRRLPPIGVAPPRRSALAPTPAPPILLPRPPTVAARAQAPGWFSPEDFAQTVTPPPPAAIAEAPALITAAPATTIFDPGSLVSETIEPKPARLRVILDALRTRIGPWTRHRTYVLSGVAAASLCAGGLFAWTQRPAVVPVVDPGPSSAEVTRILFERTGFTVTTSPPGAEIHVDGRPTGRVTPERVSGFTPGLHAIELKLPGHYDTSLGAVLEEGSTLVMPPVRLRPRPPAGSAQ
ncbi:MAG TPA: PEGA domain-containing protein [Polyangiales bacterium]|nr:PEGA domain-containing protein [Polyangiales bacterium]